MKNSKISDCQLIDLPQVHKVAGNITALNNGREINFDIKRIYYLYDVPGGEARGGHGHKELQQLIVAGSGSFDIHIDDGSEKKTFHLSRPYKGLLMPPGLWRELDNFSSGAICLVLASTLYAEEDYIRNYADFVNYKKG
jgi:hypothetical protein